jgi:hypothetical protein
VTTALCLSGQLRCFKQAYPSIKEHLIDPLKADVYVSVWNYLMPDERNEQDGTLLDFIDLYRPVQFESYNFGELEHQWFSRSPLCQHGAEGVHVERILAMWNRINRAFLLTSDKRYDLYIRCRCDLKFLTGIPIGEIAAVLTTEQIGIPFSRDYDTIRNDQFAFGGFDAILKYTHISSTVHHLVEQGFRIHPERLLFEHLKLIGLETLPSAIQYRVIRPWGEENPCITEACSSPIAQGPVSSL